MADYKKQGKKNRAAGAKFELDVRKDLESKGWIVSKWQNNLEPRTIDWVMISAKRKFNPFKKILGIGTGFPDFIIFQNMINEESKAVYGIVECYPLNKDSKVRLTAIIGVEAKINGILDKQEKEKCKWLLENNIFSKILIARKDYPDSNINVPPEKRKKKEIIYEEFNNQDFPNSNAGKERSMSFMDPDGQSLKCKEEINK